MAEISRSQPDSAIGEVPTPASPIFCIKQSIRESESAGSANDILRHGGYFGVAVIVLVWLSINAAFQFQLMVNLSALYAGIAAIVLAVMWLHRRGFPRRLAAILKSSSLPLAPDADCRLQLVGLADFLAAEGELADIPFEPRIFAAPRAMAPSNAMKGMAIAGGLAGIGMAMLTQFLLSRDAWRNFHIMIPAGIFIGSGITMLSWPTYVRIVPGRLDVLRFFALNSRAVQRASYDLRSAKILVDLPRQLVFIDPPFGRGVEFSLKLVSQPRELAYFVLLAAISTHQPGPLPEDELIG